MSRRRLLFLILGLLLPVAVLACQNSESGTAAAPVVVTPDARDRGGKLPDGFTPEDFLLPTATSSPSPTTMPFRSFAGVAATEVTEGGLNAGGPVELLPDQGRSHIEPGTPGGPYITNPAASGSHWITNPTDLVPVGSPARWGSYGQPLPDEVQIHNLEHGGIVINYDCPDGCSELVAQLETVISPSGSQFILAPYTNMDTRIAITAWRHQDRMGEFDADRLNAFVDAYLDRAPESVPGNLF